MWEIKGTYNIGHTVFSELYKTSQTPKNAEEGHL
jgi:hypothetical protein